MEWKTKVLKAPQSLEDAFAIREEVFIKEQGFQNEFDALDDQSWHVVVYIDTIPAACGRLFCQSGNCYVIGRVAVRKRYRGIDVGAYVMCQLESLAKEQGADTIKLSAQCQAVGFYEKMGYQQQGEIYNDEFCPHVTMYKKL